MGKINPLERSTGELKTYLVRRMFVYLSQTCTTVAYVSVEYLTLARCVGLPWLWRGSDNAKTIVVLRAALSRMERAGLLTVRGHTHNNVLVKLNAIGGE